MSVMVERLCSDWGFLPCCQRNTHTQASPHSKIENVQIEADKSDLLRLYRRSAEEPMPSRMLRSSDASYPPLSTWARSPAATPCPPPLVLRLSATSYPLNSGGYFLSLFLSLRLSATPYPPPSATFSLSRLRHVDWASSTKVSTVINSIPLTHLD